MITVGWWASSLGDRPMGITFAANTGDLLTYPMVGFPTRITWSMVMALGVPAGCLRRRLARGRIPLEASRPGGAS